MSHPIKAMIVDGAPIGTVDPHVSARVEAFSLWGRS
jgi:hypothetical protein